MRPEDRIRYLSSLDLFHHFSEEELYEFFADNVEELRVPAGEVLCREGSPGDDMYILLAGELKITKGTKFITTIQAVEYIGEMALIEAKPRSAARSWNSIPCSVRVKKSRGGTLSNQYLTILSRRPTRVSTRYSAAAGF